MKPWQLNRRLENMSEKLDAVSSGVVRLDFYSFPENEQELFMKVWEIQEKYGDHPPPDVVVANKEFIFKASEIIYFLKQSTSKEIEPA